MMDRRRALMRAEKSEDFGVQFMPSCLNWYLNGTNTKALSENSLSFAPTSVNSWGYYAYATRALTKKYSDLLGKLIIVDFDFVTPGDTLLYVSMGLLTSPSSTGGISAQRDRKNIGNTVGVPYHFHREIVVGTDYTTTDYTDLYLSLGMFAINYNTKDIPITVKSLKCGYR